MKFRVERDVLAEAVTWVARGLPNHPPVPVLAGVLIEASDEGTLTLSAFDYEVSAKITVAAEVAEPGTVLVLGRLLADISRNLPDRPIDVFTEGNKVQVTCGSSRFSLLMMPADDYPTLPSAPAISGTIAGDVFTQAVAQVSIAADRGDTLPILTGVRVEIEGDKITLLATDRYRLAMRELTWNPHATDISHVALVPARTLSDTSKALGALGSVEIHLGSGTTMEGLIGFEAGQRLATTRLLDGEYPKGHLDLPVQRRHRVGHRDRWLWSRRSSEWPWSPNATPLSGCTSATARSPSRPAPAMVPRPVRRSRPCWSDRRSRSPSTRSSCWTGWERWGRHTAACPSPRAGRPAVLSGQAELGGDADTSYRYVLMPVRFAS